MKPLKIYLAGPMRGIPAFNFPTFHEAAAKLRFFGHEVFSPAERDIERHNGVDISHGMSGDENELVKVHGFSKRDAFHDDMVWICKHATAIAMLPKWEQSLGATAEHALAKALDLAIIYLALCPDGLHIPPNVPMLLGPDYV